MHAPVLASVATLLIGFVVWSLSKGTIKLQRQIIGAQKETIATLQEKLERCAPEQVKMTIRITAPKNSAEVPAHIKVIGTVEPRAAAIQVLVLSGDGRWHRQQDVRTNGRTWEAECWIGTADAAPGSRYEIIAIDGRERVTEPLERLPLNVAQSSSLIVYRQ